MELFSKGVYYREYLMDYKFDQTDFIRRPHVPVKCYLLVLLLCIQPDVRSRKSTFPNTAVA